MPALHELKTSWCYCFFRRSKTVLSTVSGPPIAVRPPSSSLMGLPWGRRIVVECSCGRVDRNILFFSRGIVQGLDHRSMSSVQGVGVRLRSSFDHLS